MIKERTELSNDEIIEAYLRSCKRKVEEIKQGNKPKSKKQEEKKKEPTKIKKKYYIYLKAACFIGLITVFGSMWASTFVPNVVQVIIAFLESLDPFKQFKGGNALDPSHFVMFLK
jgi:hypothetical protein